MACLLRSALGMTHVYYPPRTLLWNIYKYFVHSKSILQTDFFSYEIRPLSEITDWTIMFACHILYLTQSTCCQISITAALVLII